MIEKLDEGAKKSMCYFCFYGSSGKCISPRTLAFARSQGLTVEEVVEKRKDDGECRDASEWERNLDFEKRNGNQVGLIFSRGRWKWNNQIERVVSLETQEKRSEVGRRSRKSPPEARFSQWHTKPKKD